MILIKRIYDKFYITDGRKVLVDRLWPRGIRHNTANVDVWLKNVAPTDELRKWYNHEPRRWNQFKKRYTKELTTSRAVLQLIQIILSTDPVTLVYATSDNKHNSAVVLLQYLKRKLRNKNPLQ
jgi:uncharacterized protein YeaO (DUF488 family)